MKYPTPYDTLIEPNYRKFLLSPMQKNSNNDNNNNNLNQGGLLNYSIIKKTS